MSGGKDRDRLEGGTGDDTLDGGDGQDTFVFSIGDGADRVGDFKKGHDLQATDLTWASLDTNANNKLDDADLYVSVSSGDTFIDLGAAGGGLGGVDALRLDDVTNLKSESFVF